jgi:DNA-binding CsgD family transcriptional regulator
MKRTVIVFGAIGGLLVAALRLIEYRFLVVEHSLQIYGGLVAAVFAGVGLWLGLTITKRRRDTVGQPPPAPGNGPTGGTATGDRGETRMGTRLPLPNAARATELAITPRELEILELIAAGLSNREIADRLFVSENTVKTHAARLLDKLGAKRRTQAVQRARDEGLIA